jgi:hypothetical protein
VTNAAPILDDIEAYLLSVDHEKKLADDTVALLTTIYRLFSILHMLAA